MKIGTKKKYRIAMITVIVALVLFVSLYWEIRATGGPTLLDSVIQNWAAEINEPIIIGFLTFITHFGSKIVLVPLIAIAGIWFWLVKKDKVAAILIVIAYIGGIVLKDVLKVVIARERPSINEAIDGTGYSFPSGHAMIGLLIYALLTYFVIQNMELSNRKKLILMSFSIVFIFLIGLSRIVLYVHYPTDVIAGYAAGIILVIIFIRWYHWLKNLT
ncbi:phosphatase PAP2 family protein [Bacillus solimangrovi]|uniref:Phosphatidic acid phosphatase type 2/haloperoxidase domain-containing protein n=1 Tax=Bacillus solimangrovi TaxID=1305675 RepID=A0A1E5LEA2_9BACI|nr:phosphatase PAP2 family protein [Bacillus solimangrovi]OEH92400.1 hypothetical protein BFG57_15945 [Bacillus solimangrovi]